MLFQSGYYGAIVFLARSALGGKHQRSKAQLLRGGDPARVGLIRDDDRDARVGNVARGDVAGDGFEIRAASGKQDAEILHAIRMWTMVLIGLNCSTRILCLSRRTRRRRRRA